MLIRVANILLDPRFGGPQHRVLQVAQRLEELEIDQVVVIPKADSRYLFTRLRDHGIRVIRAALHRPKRGSTGLFIGAVTFFPEVILLALTLRRKKIQVVHCNGVWQLHGIFAGKLGGAKVLLHLNDTWSSFWIRTIFKIVSPLCDGFIVAGEKVRKNYFGATSATGKSGRSSKPVFEIPAPVDPDIFDPERVTPDPDLPVEGRLVVTTVCSVNWMKGLEYFIEMAEVLNRQNPDTLVFRIVGPLPDTQSDYIHRLRQLAERLNVTNLEFTGMRSDVPAVLAATDIYVCSSVQEASPMSVWEAMAMTVPVVSTDVGDVARHIHNGENGFVVPVGDVEALAEKVSTLAIASDLRSEFGERARRDAIESLSVANCAKLHAEAYKEIIS